MQDRIQSEPAQSTANITEPTNEILIKDDILNEFDDTDLSAGYHELLEETEKSAKKIEELENLVNTTATENQQLHQQLDAAQKQAEKDAAIISNLRRSNKKKYKLLKEKDHENAELSQEIAQEQREYQTLGDLLMQKETQLGEAKLDINSLKETLSIEQESYKEICNRLKEESAWANHFMDLAHQYQESLESAKNEIAQLQINFTKLKESKTYASVVKMGLFNGANAAQHSNAQTPNNSVVEMQRKM